MRGRQGRRAAGKGEWPVSVLLSLFLDERLQKPCEHPNNMIIIIGLPTTKPLASEEDKEEEAEQERGRRRRERETRRAGKRVCVSVSLL